jgi:hypothetical protein
MTATVLSLILTMLWLNALSTRDKYLRAVALIAAQHIR